MKLGKRSNLGFQTKFKILYIKTKRYELNWIQSGRPQKRNLGEKKRFIVFFYREMEVLLKLISCPEILAL